MEEGDINEDQKIDSILRAFRKDEKKPICRNVRFHKPDDDSKNELDGMKKDDDDDFELNSEVNLKRY